jgi:hypothetical protein
MRCPTGCGSLTSHSKLPHSSSPPSPGLKHTSAYRMLWCRRGAAPPPPPEGSGVGVKVCTAPPVLQSTSRIVPTRSSPTTARCLAP